MPMQPKSRLSLVGGLARRKPNIGAQIAEDFAHNFVRDCLLDASLLSLQPSRQQSQQHNEANRGHAQRQGYFNQRKGSSSRHGPLHILDTVKLPLTPSI